MSFYERISKQKVNIPDRFCMKVDQMIYLKENAKGIYDLMCVVFKFGYLQGVRSERAGKAGEV